MDRREQDARDCAARRREREARTPADPDLFVCHCDHDHPPGVLWCDLCEYPIADAKLDGPRGEVLAARSQATGPV
jgi:hypothetical protein